jgi:hypothetical protein
LVLTFFLHRKNVLIRIYCFHLIFFPSTEELQQQAGVFKKNANELKNKMWWKNMKMRLIIATIVLVILGIIIGIAVAMSKN